MEIDLIPGTPKSDIVAFLYNNPESQFGLEEIQDHLGIPHRTATTTLKYLADQGLIGDTEDSFYYALGSREDLRRYTASLDQLHRMFTSPEEKCGSTLDAGTAAPEPVSDAELESELEELEDDIEI